MNGKVIRGKALEVKFANSDSSASTAASGVGTISDNIYVKGLPPLWTEVELRAFFKIFGNIIECRLLHASGTTTAGALIRFGSMEQAASAVVTANGRVPAGGQVSFFSFTYIWAM
jgi:ELAV like protein 2/3/4